MSKIPIVLVGIVAVWILVNVVRLGPDRAFGGLFGLLDEPQYGEADRPTRSGKLAERNLGPPPPDEPDDEPWWGR